MRLEIKIRDHFWTHFIATNLMVALELTNELSLKIVFFEVIIIVSVCVKFQYLDMKDFILDTEYTLGLVLTSRV